MSREVRLLGPGDGGALEAFLRARADTSMILRSNLRRGGIVDHGQPFQATYASMFVDGSLAGVAAHTWWNTCVLQAPPDAAGELVRLATAATGRPLNGLIGPWAQVTAAREQLGVQQRPTSLATREVLMALPLDDLRIPAALAEGRVACRHSVDEDVEELVRYRCAYLVETRLDVEGPELEPESRRGIELSHSEGNLFVLTEGGRIVATTAFNAKVGEGSRLEMVQVGGVYTPPALRGRGYAKCAVAGQLLDARAHGATRAVLFTGEERATAQSAYRALGFTEIGDYGLIIFRDAPAG